MENPHEPTDTVAPPRDVDSALTGRVKAYALQDLNADLVGIANIERFAKAPPLMAPQGIMPSARSVVVMAVHHPDAAIELGGQKHPQDIGPYRVQYVMNERLDEMSYRMGLFLAREGCQVVPIVSSNIWRYKGYKELTEQFAPDISHRHAAVAAGLADFGYSALAITPEYGARQRFISVITDATLEPSPLLEPGSVCDDCKLCVKHCLSHALSKEIRGTSVVEIEDKRYTYADKNLWRCAWGEHFDLDLDLEIPEEVTEEVILEQVLRHGRRGGEMGSCLRYCVPANLRYFDREYTNAPRRKRNSPEGEEAHRGLAQRASTLAYRQGADFVLVTGTEALAALGVDMQQHLPDGRTAIVLGLRYRTPEGLDTTAAARYYLLHTAAYDVVRELERHGHSAVSESLEESIWAGAIEGVAAGWSVQTATVLTSADLPPSTLRVPPPASGPASGDALRRKLEHLIAGQDAELVGFVSAQRLADLQPQLAAIFDGMPVLVARDRSGIFREYEPEIREEVVRVKTPQDHLAGAQSVIVVGLRLPQMSVERTARPPAEAVGPYTFAQYESTNLLRLLGLRAMRLLEDHGFRATLSFDLEGTGSVVGNPRGEQPDAFCNRFTAVAAGLGQLTRAGFVTTRECGPNVRFLAIITDAVLPPDTPVLERSLTTACEGCERCVAACQTAALGDLATVAIDGVAMPFHVIDRKRCDWAKRYSLNGEEGVNYLGWTLKVPVPEAIDAQNLAAALRQHPPIPKYRPCNFEACLMACPLAREQ